MAAAVLSATAIANGTGVSSITTAIASSGSNRALAVVISSGSGLVDPTTVTGTYNGVSLSTFFDDTTTVPSRPVRVIYLIAPATGTNNLVLSWSGNDFIYASAIMLTGVDQSTPFGTQVADTNGGSGGTSSSETVSSATGDLVLDILLTNNGVTGPAPTSGGSTAQTTQNNDATGATRHMQGVASTPGAASVTAGWSWTPFTVYGAWAWNVIQAASFSPDGTGAYYPSHPGRRLVLPVTAMPAHFRGESLPNLVSTPVPAVGTGLLLPRRHASPIARMPAVFRAESLPNLPVTAIGVVSPTPVLRVRLRQAPSQVAPAYVADVTSPVTPLSWGLPQALGGATPAGDTTFSYQMLGLVHTPAEILEQPWTQDPPVWPKPTAPRVGSQRTDPARVADVTTAVPLGSWQPGYPGPPGPARLRQAPSLIWGITTPATVTPITQWAGSAPDQPPAKRPILYLLKATSGSAGFDLSTTARPAFGGMQIPGWRVVQYTGLVGNLTPDPVPDLAVTTIPTAPPQLRLRILGGGVRPDLLITPVVVPDRVWDPAYPSRVWPKAGLSPRHATGQVDAFPRPAPVPDFRPTGTVDVARPPRLPVGARPVVSLPIFPVNLIAPPPGVGVVAPVEIWREIVFSYQGFAAPIKPAFDVVVPSIVNTVFPLGSQPGPRRRLPILGGVVGPLRLADLTAAVTALSWQGSAPSWIARRRAAAAGGSVLPFTTAIPFLDPTVLGWRGEAPSWVARRGVRAAAQTAVVGISPSVWAIPGVVSWLGRWPDRIWPARRPVANGGLGWEPADRPNPPSPDSAWQGWFPARVPAPARAIDRGGWVGPPRYLPFLPTWVSGLVWAPDRVAGGLRTAAAQPIGSGRFEIVIPDLRRDWAGVGRDWVPAAARRPITAGTSTAPEGNRAVSPLDWFSEDQDRVPPASALRPQTGAVSPNPAQLEGPGVSAIWLPSPSTRPVWGVWTGPAGGTILVPPSIIAGAVRCVHLRPVGVTTPGLTQPAVTATGLRSMKLWRGPLAAEVC